MNRQIMLDLETLGFQSNSAILSIGAVSFDPKTGETFDKFYEHLDVQEQLDKGAVVNESTIKWWFDQSHEARDEAAQPGMFVENALEEFDEFCESQKEHGQPVLVWGNGARFDLGLLNDIYRRWKKKTPWGMRDEMCYRTVKALYPKYFNLEFKGVRHHPIADCEYQIACLVNCFTHIYKIPA